MATVAEIMDPLDLSNIDLEDQTLNVSKEDVTQEIPKESKDEVPPEPKPVLPEQQVAPKPAAKGVNANELGASTGPVKSILKPKPQATVPTAFPHVQNPMAFTSVLLNRSASDSALIAAAAIQASATGATSTVSNANATSTSTPGLIQQGILPPRQSGNQYQPPGGGANAPQ